MVGSLKRMNGNDEDKMKVMQGVCRTAPCKGRWDFGHAMLCFGLQDKALMKITFAEDTKTMRAGFGMVQMNADKGEAKIQGFESELARRAREAKAVKADDAKVPVHLWNARIRMPGFTNSEYLGTQLSIVRERFLLRRWKQTCVAVLWRI
jgi:hypothetical protein